MQQRSRGPRPRFFADPQLDRFHVVLVAMLEEVSVLHDRVDALERVLEAHGSLDRSAIESYEPDEAAAGERERWREAYVQRVLRVVFEEASDLGRDTPRFETVQDVITSVSTS
jgi:hypothetical protein